MTRASSSPWQRGVWGEAAGGVAGQDRACWARHAAGAPHKRVGGAQLPAGVLSARPIPTTLGAGGACAGVEEQAQADARGRARAWGTAKAGPEGASSGCQLESFNHCTRQVFPQRDPDLAPPGKAAASPSCCCEHPFLPPGQGSYGGSAVPVPGEGSGNHQPFPSPCCWMSQPGCSAKGCALPPGSFPSCWAHGQLSQFFRLQAWPAEIRRARSREGALPPSWGTGLGLEPTC